VDWIDLLRQSPPLLYAVAIVGGLVIGSFLNVVILRLPKMMQAAWENDCAEMAQTRSAAADSTPVSLSHPPSSCPHCGHRIRSFENIPVVSYLALRGRCAACHQRIGLRYPAVELISALLTLAVVLQFGLSPQTLPAMILTWSLIALAVIDLDTQLLPDSITLPLIWFGLLLSLFGLFADSHDAIIGAVAGYMSLWTLFHVFRLLTGKEGMGYGDFKLLAVFGAWLGWALLPQIIVLSALTGALIGVALILSGRHARGAPMPFGPFIAAAGWLSLMWGSEINAAYLRLVGL
jgi:leader peptidase (prepilin peptidase)/N-methyltransferase